MSKFIKAKILNITKGVFISTALVTGSFVAMYFGKALLDANFILGSALIALAPLSIFFAAFYYQGSVVFPIRQISEESTDGLTGFERRFIRSAESSYSFTKLIPVIITSLSAFISVTFIPGTIGHAAITGGSSINMTIASLLISANLILFVRMANQISSSRKSIIFP